MGPAVFSPSAAAAVNSSVSPESLPVDPGGARRASEGSAMERGARQGDGGVFISYRRKDAGGYAKFLATQLVERYGDSRVFFDARGLLADEGPWRAQLDHELNRCRATLAIVGPDWMDRFEPPASDSPDAPDAPVEDIVAYELTESHRREKTVVAVLVGRARPPKGLPVALSWFEQQQFVEIVPDNERDGLDRMFGALDRSLPWTARRRNRIGVGVVTAVILSVLVSLGAVRVLNPCAFKECLDTFDVGESVVLVAPTLERVDGVLIASDPARSVTREIGAGLRGSAGGAITVHDLGSAQLDLAGLDEDERRAGALHVLQETNADMLIAAVIERTGSPTPNLTVYESTTYLGFVRDAEDLAGRQLRFATVSVDIDNDVESSGAALTSLAGRATAQLTEVFEFLTMVGHYELREFDSATAGLDRLLRNDPESRDAALLHHLRGNAALELGDYDRAASDYERAIELDPDFARARLGVAETELLRAIQLDCVRSGDVLSSLDAATETYASVAAIASSSGDRILGAKAAVGAGRVEGCRSRIFAANAPAIEDAHVDAALAYFEQARRSEGPVLSDMLRETMSVAAVSEARLILRRVSLTEQTDAAQLDRAVALIEGDDTIVGAIDRTNRRWVKAEAYELLADIHNERGDASAAAEALRGACRAHEAVTDREPVERIAQQSLQTFTRLGC